MEYSVFINACGHVVEIPLNTMPDVIYDLIEDVNCPAHSGIPEASRGGDAYESGYIISEYERDRLIDEAKSDPNVWAVVFFFDSIAAKQ